MSRINKIMGQFLAFARRVIGSSDSGYGEITFITQLDRRIDVIAREMATQVRYCICHWLKSCRHCGFSWQEMSEMPEKLHRCPRCESWNVVKHDHTVEIFQFANIKAYEGWRMFGMKSYYRRYLIEDIEKVFPMYDTFQWQSLFDSFES